MIILDLFVTISFLFYIKNTHSVSLLTTERFTFNSDVVVLNTAEFDYQFQHVLNPVIYYVLHGTHDHLLHYEFDFDYHLLHFHFPRYFLPQILFLNSTAL